jgi:hypothetical protein
VSKAFTSEQTPDLGRRGEAEVRLAPGEVRRLEVAVSAAVPARAPGGR